jgi:hypothetical protein
VESLGPHGPIVVRTRWFANVRFPDYVALAWVAALGLAGSGRFARNAYSGSTRSLLRELARAFPSGESGAGQTLEPNLTAMTLKRRVQ